MDVKRRMIASCMENCYIVDGRIMIDPGDGIEELDAFTKETGAKIEAIVLTHGHFDHTLGAAHIKRKFGAKIYISEADAECLTDEDACIVLPCAVTPFEPVEPDVLLGEGPVSIAGIDFEVLLTPGHTKGSLCLLNRKDKQIFTGDTLFRFGYGRTDLRGGDMNALFLSLRRLLRLPGDYYMYPGHGDGAYLQELRGGFMG